MHPRRLFARAALCLFPLIAAACGPTASTTHEVDALTPGSDIKGVALTCHDGDTCQVLLDGSNVKITVRLIGIDAPETSGGEGNQGQPLGKAAKAQLNELVKGRPVRVHVHTSDKYERTLGEIYVESLHVNVEMLERGFAEAYIWSTSAIEKPAYRDAQARAKASGMGIWSLPNYESPGAFRQRVKAP